MRGRRRRNWAPIPAAPIPVLTPEQQAEHEAQMAAHRAQMAEQARRAVQKERERISKLPLRYGEVVTVKPFEGEEFLAWVTRIEPHKLPEMANTPADAKLPQAAAAQELVANVKAGNWSRYWQSKNALGGATNMAQIDKLFAEGWAEGAVKARKLADELDCDLPMAESTRRRRVVGKDGTDVILEAWLDRDIDRLFESRKRFSTMGHRVIQIGLGWGGNAGKTGEEMFWAGAAALVLTEALEAAGYGVEVHAYATVHASDYKSLKVLDVVVKPSEQPVAPDTFAAVVCHAGVYRAYGIAATGHCPFDMGYGFGHCVNIDDFAVSLADAGVIQPIEILLPNVYDRNSALEAVRRALLDMGAVQK